MKKVKSKNRRLKNRCSKNNRLKNSRQKKKRKNRRSNNVQPKSEQAKNKQPESKQQIGEQSESSQPKNELPQKPKKRGVAKKFFTAVCITLCVLLIPLIVANLILIIKGYTNKDEVPSLFSVSPMYVITDSMVPTINGGDLIFVKKVAPEDIDVEDIIAFFDPESMEGTIIVHRVKEISTDKNGNTTFRTMGDANNVYDTFIISGENVVGRYVFHIRGLGRAAMFMQTAYGLIITVSIPLIMLIGYEVVRQLVFLKREREDNTATSKDSE